VRQIRLLPVAAYQYGGLSGPAGVDVTSRDRIADREFMRKN